jgi:hypothetical protein
MSVDQNNEPETTLSRRGFLTCLTLLGASAVAAAELIATGAEAAPDATTATKSVEKATAPQAPIAKDTAPQADKVAQVTTPTPVRPGVARRTARRVRRTERRVARRTRRAVRRGVVPVK